MDKEETLHYQYLVEKDLLDEDQGFVEYLDKEIRIKLGEALVDKIYDNQTYVVRMGRPHIEFESDTVVFQGRVAYKNSILIKPMVVCKECANWRMCQSECIGWCVCHNAYFPPDYYCADSERKESE